MGGRRGNAGRGAGRKGKEGGTGEVQLGESQRRKVRGTGTARRKRAGGNGKEAEVNATGQEQIAREQVPFVASGTPDKT